MRARARALLAEEGGDGEAPAGPASPPRLPLRLPTPLALLSPRHHLRRTARAPVHARASACHLTSLARFLARLLSRSVQFFAPFGEIVSCRIMVERESGLSRGFGVVSIQHPESAERAIVNLTGESRGAAC